MRTEVYAVLNPDKMLRGQNCGAFFIPALFGYLVIDLLSFRNKFGTCTELFVVELYFICPLIAYSD